MNYKQLMAAGLAAILSWSVAEAAEPFRVPLDPSMVTNEAAHGTPEAIVDEQDKIGDPPSNPAETGWTFPSQHWKTEPTVAAFIDLGEEKHLANIQFYDFNGKGDVQIFVGKPGEWKHVATYDCAKYKQWGTVQLDTTTRYIRLQKMNGGANFNEIALYAYTPEDWKAVNEQKQAEARAAEERAAALAKAEAEAANRPTVDLGYPFGEVKLVDEVDIASADPGHMFTESPANASRIETILGKPARVLNKTEGEAAFMAVRLGQFKLLKPGNTYIVEIEYPEDAPRSMVIMNGGNETHRGFHTGIALGDAHRPKYVNNLNESLNVPLSGKYQTWRHLFNLHDRTPNMHGVRGSQQPRELFAEDGFTVTIAQFSAENIPASQGAAVSRIRLYEVPDFSKLAVNFRLPPEGLPRRHLFWREEMADGVLDAEWDKDPDKHTGLKDPIDWFRYKANQMQFLGMHTYSKDLLEFGAVQHWDPTEGGGGRWVHHNGRAKGWWEQIVKVMGERGFEVLPYYEYAGSKGPSSLGMQRRAKPLTRDDAFTHIKWVESANADLTDPAFYDDFKKILDLTVVKFKDDAKFVGAWLRPRNQMPMGFGDATRKRFAEEANNGVEVSRKELAENKALYEKYTNWWFGKRREFLVAMRDHLRSKGIDDATILYTANAGEPGVPFATWDPYFVTDDVEGWTQRFANSPYEKDKSIKPISVQDVVAKGMYMEALTAPPKTWGGWEWQHAGPQSDPQNYKETDGVLLTHAINRLYTVADPQTLELFRGSSGLAVLRHYSLNENMMFDKNDQSKLGYFVADIERAGPYCMMAEAVAMANGDPRFIGYLVGANFGRGFPEYVRNFNMAFLSLPALPSTRLEGAASDKEVVVRSIPTPNHGTYLAIVNTGMTDKNTVTIKLPKSGKVVDSATGEAIEVNNGSVTLNMYPYQLRALHIEQ